MVGVFALWLFATLSLSLFASWAWPLLRRLTSRGAPQSRALVYFVYASLPPAAAALTVLFVMHPQWSAWLVPSHCHDANCSVHQPVLGLMQPIGAALAAGSLSFLVLLGVILQRGFRRMRRLLSMLRELAEEVPSFDYSLVQSTQPIAWCAGLLAPRVYLSSGLAAALSPAELQIVLAHEHAHARRRDNLRRLLVTGATFAWPRAQRRELQASFTLALEQTCDAAAAAHIGSAGAVVRLLERISELLPHPTRLPHMAFADRDQGLRISALVKPRCNRGQLAAAWSFITVLWVSSPAVLAGPGHHLLEWLMSL